MNIPQYFSFGYLLFEKSLFGNIQPILKIDPQHVLSAQGEKGVEALQGGSNPSPSPFPSRNLVGSLDASQRERIRRETILTQQRRRRVLNTSGAPAQPDPPVQPGFRQLSHTMRRVPKAAILNRRNPKSSGIIPASFEQCTRLEVDLSNPVKVLQSKINLIKLVRI